VRAFVGPVMAAMLCTRPWASNCSCTPLRPPPAASLRRLCAAAQQPERLRENRARRGVS
jgi:hypothetical protein